MMSKLLRSARTVTIVLAATGLIVAAPTGSAMGAAGHASRIDHAGTVPEAPESGSAGPRPNATVVRHAPGRDAAPLGNPRRCSPGPPYVSWPCVPEKR